MGKTTLLFHLLNKLRRNTRTAFIFQTQCSSREFLRLLLADLGCDRGDQDFVRMHEEFNRRLLQEARSGNRLIVMIDEGQNLDASVLETVRLLSDFETPQAKLMQIVLVGQPELAAKLASSDLVQLRQRISIMAGLEPLSHDEVVNYIEHRLGVAGYTGGTMFTSQALAALSDLSQGVPRNINNYCFNALSVAFALKRKTIDLAILSEVASDLDFTRFVSGNRSSNLDAMAPVLADSWVPANFATSAHALTAQTAVDLAGVDEAREYLSEVVRSLKRPANASPVSRSLQ